VNSNSILQNWVEGKRGESAEMEESDLNDKWINLRRGVGTRALYEGGKPGTDGEPVRLSI
jgi:hypothetical protein